MMKVQIGSVHQFDHQSDIYHGSYRIIEDLGKGVYLAERLEPSDELIDEVLKYYLESEHPYLDYVDPFGPGRREATRQETADMEIMRRIDNAGTTFKVSFVSAATWAEMF